ncbi:hypothetical protein TCAL_14527 [Tigriopus californicus]|uniref:C-type lectin domain-containing protein n=1 Tax=Tigriopus californicus TaxID=6832 RepID=A0A553PRS5_TIGCA|nr:uncharacterized protein LOC131891745 [Tigriopus californicus]TRY80389.1 hypothetical protein TCAL_14527 [Tigriopus californicus]
MPLSLLLFGAISFVYGDETTRFVRVRVDSSKILSTTTSSIIPHLATGCAQLCSQLGSKSCNALKWADNAECSIYVLNLTTPLVSELAPFVELLVDAEQACQVNTLGYAQVSSGTFWKKSGIMNQSGSANIYEVTFDVAKAFCLDENAGMLKFETPEDYDYFTNSTNANSRPWVGLTNPSGESCNDETCNGKLRWEDGTAFTFNSKGGNSVAINTGQTCFGAQNNANGDVRITSMPCNWHRTFYCRKVCPLI